MAGDSDQGKPLKQLGTDEEQSLLQQGGWACVGGLIAGPLISFPKTEEGDAAEDELQG